MILKLCQSNEVSMVSGLVRSTKVTKQRTNTKNAVLLVTTVRGIMKYLLSEVFFAGWWHVPALRLRFSFSSWNNNNNSKWWSSIYAHIKFMQWQSVFKRQHFLCWFVKFLAISNEREWHQSQIQIQNCVQLLCEDNHIATCYVLWRQCCCNETVLNFCECSGLIPHTAQSSDVLFMSQGPLLVTNIQAWLMSQPNSLQDVTLRTCVLLTVACR